MEYNGEHPVGYVGIDHLGIAVPNLDEAVALYVSTLGFQELRRETMTERGIAVSFLDAGNAKLELIAPLNNQSEVSKFLTKRGSGIHHVCIRVADLQAAIDDIASKGGRIVGNGIQDGAHGTKVAFVHPKSTQGVLLELQQDA